MVERLTETIDFCERESGTGVRYCINVVRVHCQYNHQARGIELAIYKPNVMKFTLLTRIGHSLITHILFKCMISFVEYII